MQYRNLALLIVLFCLAANAGAVTRCCAHRGDNKNAPENTLPAIALAVQKQAHQIEFDVQRTSDGQLVIMHDATVDRTTNGSGKVAEMTFEQIRALDAGSWFSEKFAGTQVPTPEEVLELIPHTILCNVHLKGDPQLGADTARVISAANRLDHCFLACTLEMAAEARKVAPGIMICNMSRQGFNRKPYIDQTIESGTAFIQLFHGSGTKGLQEDVARLHSNKVRVNWFGASDEALIRTLVAADVDYILTDDVDLCLSIVNENPLANEPFDEKVTSVTKN